MLSTTAKSIPSSPINTAASPAKSQVLPTLMRSEMHGTWVSKLREEVIPKLEAEVLSSEEKTKFISSLKDEVDSALFPVESLPLKLHNYAHQHSLKRTKEELELQREVENLPRAGMAGAPDEANLLSLLMELMDAKTVIEVGVFRGITTLTFAQCLRRLMEKNPQAGTRKVIGLDISSDFATVGQKYWKEARVDDIIDFRVGDAKQTLDELIQEFGIESVDLCFIDADKTSYDEYYEKCMILTKKGGLICIDNTLWGGRVLTPSSVLDTLANKVDEEVWETEAIAAKSTQEIKKLVDKVSNDERIERISFLTMADGVMLCRKK